MEGDKERGEGRDTQEMNGAINELRNGVPDHSRPHLPISEYRIPR